MYLIMNNAHLYQLAFKEMKTMELKNQYNYEDDIHIENMVKTSGSSGSSSSNKKPSTLKSSSLEKMKKNLEKLNKEDLQKMLLLVQKRQKEEEEERLKKEEEERLKKEKEKIKEDASNIWVLPGLLKLWNKNTKDWYKEKDGEQENLVYTNTLSTYFINESNHAHVKIKLEENFSNYGGFILFKWENGEINVNTGGWDNNEICLGGKNIRTLEIAANHLWIDHDHVFGHMSVWKNICVEQKLWNKQTKEQRQLFKEELVKLQTGTKIICTVTDDEHGTFGV